MSNEQPSAPRRRARPAPMIGALLRMPHEVIEARMLATLEDNGFPMTPTELRVFLYPGPDGRRPIDLARQCGMTRQAMNYVLAALEGRGLIERRTGAGLAARVVRLTDDGWKISAYLRTCVAGVEREWIGRLGARRFRALRDTLRDLSRWLGKLD